jgi:hypothetical protein
LQDIVHESQLECQFLKTFICDSYSYHQAVESTDTITIFVLGNRKYKPVSTKVHPVVSYNPDSHPLVFNPLRLGELPPLLMKLVKLEDLEYTDCITKERMSLMLGKIPSGFLSMAEMELLMYLILKY